MLQWIPALLRTLTSPPERARVYGHFNRVRQHYILQASVTHFGKRPDDPAPLLGMKLLDVGCGESTIGEFLALSGADITAVDPCSESLKKAKTSADQYGAPVIFVQSRVEDMLNSLSRFDIILALDVLESVDDAAKLLWVLKQLLNPKGVIIFSMINRTPKAWLVHKLLSEWVYQRSPKGSRHWTRFHTPRQLSALAAKVGLAMTGVEGLHFDVGTQRWTHSSAPDTRYMAVVTEA